MQYDVVIRCKNEIEWLPRVINSLTNQTKKPANIIVVDDASTDGSPEYAAAHDCKVINYDKKEFNYSYALNLGLRETVHENVLILSAHCELVTDNSVENMEKVLVKYNAAGVYGRQIPTLNSNAIDTRDLLTTFGREEIIFVKFPFFHNAFSFIQRSAWEDIEFDEKCNGIEDRIWSRDQALRGRKIVYTPDAIVFHEHGLNQGASEQRAARVCIALATLHEDDVFDWPHFS
jgi:rhamnosyltransferase